MFLKKIMLWLPVLLWMGLIFFLSSRSNPYAYIGQDWQKDCRSLLSSDSYFQLRCEDEYLGRLAHLGVYCILTLLIHHALTSGKWWSNSGGALVWTAILVWGYGWSDEIHQLFVPGRSFQRLDLALDLAGVAAGITCIYLVYFWQFRKRRTSSTHLV